MLSDCHVHTDFSGDCQIPMENMVRRGIELGLPRICFTDHCDMDMVYDGVPFEFDVEACEREVIRLRNLLGDRIEIGFGIEMGMQPCLADRISRLLARHRFDYVIGSVHAIDGADPYERDRFDMSDRELYRLYFEKLAENLDAVDGIHALGHLDYVVRYGYHKELEYDPDSCRDQIELILRKLIDRGIALELNTAGWKYGLPFPNPHPDILKRYKELGGERVTLGSDAHRPEHMAYAFDAAVSLLEELGFCYLAEFAGGELRMRKIR